MRMRTLKKHKQCGIRHWSTTFALPLPLLCLYRPADPSRIKHINFETLEPNQAIIKIWR